MSDPPQSLPTRDKPDPFAQALDQARRLNFIVTLLWAIWAVISAMTAQILNAYQNLGFGLTLLIGLVLALLGTQIPNLFKYTRDRVSPGGIVSARAIGIGLTAIVMVAIVFGAQHLIFVVTRQTPTAGHPSSLPNRAKEPIYLTNVGLGAGPNKQLTLSVTMIETVPRLRIFAEYQIVGTSERNIRVPIADLNEPVKGESRRVPLITSTETNQPAPTLFWWGDSSANHRLYCGQNLFSLIPIRVIAIDPSGREDDHFESLLVCAHDPSDGFRVFVQQDTPLRVDW